MRIIPDEVKATYPGTRTMSMAVSFENPKTDFEKNLILAGVGLDDPSIQVDMCLYAGTKLLRVAVSNMYLCTQLCDLAAGTFGTWTSTGIALKVGSRPGVEASEYGATIWYQAVSGVIWRRTLDAAGALVAGQSGATNVSSSLPMACAPVYDGCYTQRMDGAWLTIQYIDADGNTDIWPGRVYGNMTTQNYLDAVRILDANYVYTDYIYTMDRAAGRTLEIMRPSGQWVGPTQVLPLDIVDNNSGFTLAYASVINDRVFVTGRLVQSNDMSPIAMDIFAVGPQPYEFGRYKFLTEQNVGGKLLQAGTKTFYVGVNQYLAGFSSATFLNTAPSKTWASEHGQIEVVLSDTESGGSQLDMELTLGETVAENNEVYLDLVVDGNPIRLGSYGVTEVGLQTTGAGQAKLISGVGKSLARLERWHPFQSIYLASQTAMSSNPASLTNVLRVTGLFETNTNGRLVSTELNKLGLMYSVARASASCIARGQFYYPTSSVLVPRYGVGVGYYQESRDAAAKRLGVDPATLTDAMVGQNGIVAVYSKAENNGSPGIVVYLMTGSVLTPLISVSVTLPANQLHWMQIQFVNGRYIVMTRVEGVAAWTTHIDEVYNDQSRAPWSEQGDGRGFLYLENKTSYATTPGFSASDTIIPVDTVAPITAASLRVDEEMITHNGLSNNRAVVKDLKNAFQCGGRLGYDAGWKVTGKFPVVIKGKDTGHSDTEYVGCCLTVTAGTGKGRNWRIYTYDAASPATWVTSFLHNPATDDWHDYIDIPSHGSWVTGQHRVCWISEDAGSILAADSVLAIMPAIYAPIANRGVGNTPVVTHSATKVALQTVNRVECALFETFSGEMDISIADAFTRVFKMAGAGTPTFATALLDPLITAPWMPAQWVTGRRNFIADLNIPDIGESSALGFSFRHNSVPMSVGTNGPFVNAGYMVLVRRYSYSHYLEFWKCTNVAGTFALKESVMLPFFATGNLRLSVQDNTFSVWINQQPIHSFQDGPTDVDVQAAVGDVGGVFSVIASYPTRTNVFVPELCEKLPDLPIDTMSNGWSAITTIIAQRRIYFADTPDGSIYCYQTRTHRGNAPDIVVAWKKFALDRRYTRIRAEGVKIGEYVNWYHTWLYGDVGMPINASYANSAGEVMREARLAQTTSMQEAGAHQLETLLYPEITSGDTWDFLLNGYRIAIQIRAVGIKFSVADKELSCSMTIEGIDG